VAQIASFFTVAAIPEVLVVALHKDYSYPHSIVIRTSSTCSVLFP